MTRRKQFVLSVADRPGLLGRLVSRLWENGVTISELEAVVDGGRVAVHLTVDESAVMEQSGAASPSGRFRAARMSVMRRQNTPNRICSSPSEL